LATIVYVVLAFHWFSKKKKESKRIIS